MNYFITGIDTDSGKTFSSAIVCQALKADYWKPIQAGYPRDADTVRNLIDPSLTIHPEAYLLNTPASPHAAAKLDGIEIKISEISMPITTRPLVIEGAGGCLVPLNDHEFIVDLIPHFHAIAIIVADIYLGSINHTLLTIEALKKRDVTIAGIIFNGPANPESERIILHHSALKCLLKIEREDVVNKKVIYHYANKLIENWHG